MVKFDLYWYSFVYEDNPYIRKRRPVLALGSGKVIPVAKITSHSSRTDYDYSIVNWAKAGLPKPSVIRFDKKEIIVVSALSQKDYIGHLTNEDIQNIIRLKLI